MKIIESTVLYISLDNDISANFKKALFFHPSPGFVVVLIEYRDKTA